MLSEGLKMKVLKVKEIPLPVVRDLLEARQKRAPLESYQLSALHHSSRFSKLTSDKAERLMDELVNNFKISRISAAQIVNILPLTIQELRTLLAKEGRVFLTEDLEKILELIKSYVE
ncbi:MAG: RNA polymerase Rpb4 family protein [Candidatus Nezhaarchaeota archaeon]|nr:RNA polymerase Rpb4 family protein [Candidatus Nezhaarchaeota archaeon]MCX8141871.1 RNA polymerase Rpb4 family protein [Candidatus Nezhaarchaeota archaeon]